MDEEGGGEGGPTDIAPSPPPQKQQMKEKKLRIGKFALKEFPQNKVAGRWKEKKKRRLSSICMKWRRRKESGKGRGGEMAFKLPVGWFG